MTKSHEKLKGPIAWMASNSVAANLCMITLIVGGAIIGLNVKQEVMPEFQLDMVSVSIPYPGASPEEVEKGILLAVEEEIRGLDGVKKLTATATEGLASAAVELESGYNSNKALQDVKNAVDRITSFPEDSERPQVSLVTNRREVISLVIHGDLEERVLRNLAEKVREELLAAPSITSISISGVRPPEIHIEVPQEKQRAYNLTLDQIAARIRANAVELPAGGVKTESGEILLRTAERRDYGREFADIPIITRPDGTNVPLKDVANIVDGFRDTDQFALYNNQPAVRVSISRVGDQKPIEIAEQVKAYAAELQERLPEGVGIATWYDASEMYADRVDLLQRNALFGLVLVFIVLSLFLELRLAFWVVMGIPISIMGSFLLLPSLDVSINMISLFAFIVTLGIVVDDAVVVGENVYEMRQRGYNYLEAAIRGAKQVAVPVTFSILTNIAAFTPMLFVPGLTGKFFRVIPIIVISVFLISLLESLFILPAHLAHQKPRKQGKYRNLLYRGQQRFANLLDMIIHRMYKPSLVVAIRHRYLTLALGISIFLLTIGVVASGRINFTFLPKIDTDMIVATAVLPFGSPVTDTEAVSQELTQTARQVLENHGGDNVVRGIFSTVGSTINMGHGPGGGAAAEGGHKTSVAVYLVPTDQRDVNASQFAREWRNNLDGMVGLESLSFDYSTGPSSGAAINVQLSHRDLDTLETAAADLAEKLGAYAGVKDINDGFSKGKPQFDFTMKPEAEALGLSAGEVGRQLRDGFYGSRAFRQQRGRDEVWVMVRLPEDERRSEYHINQFLIRTPQGGELPLGEAVNLDRGNSYTVINRTDGKRVVNVTADVSDGEANANKVLADVQAEALPALLAKYPGLGVGYEGQQKEQSDANTSLLQGFVLAMIVIFGMLAIPFRSYFQPLLVMMAIPFGIVGAVLGHVVMGYDLSMISMMGIIALSGVVVNDSLVLIHAANERRRDVDNPIEAIMGAGMRRFRPIILTSLTTFFGLAPMIFETSVQARFLIPMAISLGFGILFGTFIILLLVPSLYMIMEDVRNLFGVKDSHDRTNAGEPAIEAQPEPA